MLVFPALFFPGEDATTAMLSSFATFSIAFFARPVGAVVFGHWTEEWVDDALAQNPTFCGVVQEYIAHGADKVYLTDHPRLALYSMETYALLMERLARQLG